MAVLWGVRSNPSIFRRVLSRSRSAVYTRSGLPSISCQTVTTIKALASTGLRPTPFQTLSQAGGSESTAHFNRRKASSLSTCLRLSYKAQGKPFFRSFIPKHSAVQQNKLNQSFTPIPCAINLFKCKLISTALDILGALAPGCYFQFRPLHPKVGSAVF
jgi:hypothetical protein